MEKLDVIIKIVDYHEVDGENEGAEITSVGTFEGNENDYTLRYKETGDLAGCEVTLNVKNKNTVTMTRPGEQYSTQLIMQQGKRHNCFYNTPAGELMLGVYTNKVSSTVNENGGKLNFSYTLTFNADLVSENKLKITVQKA